VRYGFGIDLGGTTVKMACFAETGDCLEKWEIPTVTGNHGQQILPDIAKAIEDCIKRNAFSSEQIMGIGIGVPGPVSPKGVVNQCVNVGWGVCNIHEELSRLTGFPVKAGNDATVAALGECYCGGGQGAENMVMVTFGTGVGGGMVLGGKIWSGVHGAAGEIGHMVLNREETEVCSCGKKGCVEQYCSATGIVRLAKQFLSKTDAPTSLRKENLTCKDVFDAGETDPVAQQILTQVYAYMGEFIANICDVIDPELVVIGGGVSKAGQPLLEGIRRYFDKYVFHANRDVRFALATLGNDAGIYGAFKLICKGES